MQPGLGLGFAILSGLAASVGAVWVCWHILSLFCEGVSHVLYLLQAR